MDFSRRVLFPFCSVLFSKMMYVFFATHNTQHAAVNASISIAPGRTMTGAAFSSPAAITASTARQSFVFRCATKPQ